MFANTSLGVMNMGFPDVCKVPVGPAIVPMPFPNVAVSSSHIPSVFNVVIGGGLAENLATAGTISNGDQAGAVGGVVSNLIMGPDRPMLGSMKVMIGGPFATRLTSTNGQNGMPPNIVGVSITPAQVQVVLLS